MQLVAIAKLHRSITVLQAPGDAQEVAESNHAIGDMRSPANVRRIQGQTQCQLAAVSLAPFVAVTSCAK